MDLLIVEPIDSEAVAWLAERYEVRFAPELTRDPAALRRALSAARAAILPAGMAVDAALLRHAPKLRVLARISPGPENIDVDACLQARVEVFRSPVATAPAEAEFMLGAMLQLLRRVPMPGGDAYREGRELGGGTVGLVGLTPAARHLAHLLRAFGARVVGYDPAAHANDPVWARWRIAPVGLRELIAGADAVCVQLAYFTRYRGLLGERLLPHCRSNQVIVSISQSGVFDEAALARALDHGVVSAAWLDNVEPGTLDPGRPLADAKNLFVTPRLAAATRESSKRAAWLVARRVDELLAQPPDNRAELTRTPAAVEPGLAADPVTR